MCMLLTKKMHAFSGKMHAYSEKYTCFPHTRVFFARRKDEVVEISNKEDAKGGTNR